MIQITIINGLSAVLDATDKKEIVVQFNAYRRKPERREL